MTDNASHNGSLTMPAGSASSPPPPPAPSSLHAALSRSVQLQLAQLAVPVRMHWRGADLHIQIADGALPALHACLARLTATMPPIAAAASMQPQLQPLPLPPPPCTQLPAAPMQLTPHRDDVKSEWISPSSCNGSEALTGASIEAHTSVAAAAAASSPVMDSHPQRTATEPTAAACPVVQPVQQGAVTPQLGPIHPASSNHSPLTSKQTGAYSDADDAMADAAGRVVKAGGRVQLAPPTSNEASLQNEHSRAPAASSVAEECPLPPLEPAPGASASQAMITQQLTEPSSCSGAQQQPCPSHFSSPVAHSSPLSHHQPSQLLMLSPKPAEVSADALQRGVEVSEEAVWRLFAPYDPVRPHFLSLPYTYLHLLPTLAQRLQRPLHVLIHARIVGVRHIRLEGAFEMRVQVQDDHSSLCDLRFSPAYMEGLLGCSADQLAQLPEPAKDALYDRLQATIDAPPGIMQLRIQPQSQSAAAAGGASLAGGEAEILNIRAASDADIQMLQRRAPLPAAITRQHECR